MKKLFSITALLAVLAIMFSCGGLNGGIDLTDQKQIDTKLRAELQKYLTPETVVLELMLHGEGSAFTNSATSANITYLDESTGKAASLMVYFTNNLTPEEGIVSHSYKMAKTFSGVKLSEIDFSAIASNVNQGVKLMTEKNIKFSGFGDYTISLNSDPTKITCSFDLESKVNATEYYDVRFEVVNGQVVMIEE